MADAHCVLRAYLVDHGMVSFSRRSVLLQYGTGGTCSAALRTTLVASCGFRRPAYTLASVGSTRRRSFRGSRRRVRRNFVSNKTHCRAFVYGIARFVAS